MDHEVFLQRATEGSQNAKKDATRTRSDQCSGLTVMNQFATIYQVFDAIPREIDFLIDRLGSSSLKLLGERTRPEPVTTRFHCGQNRLQSAEP